MAPAPGGGLDARELSPDEIRGVVRRALAGDGCLQDLMNAALFGETYERDRWRWGDWPAHARTAWDQAVALYAARKGFEGRVHATPANVTVDQAWDAIESAQPYSADWPDLPGVIRSDIPTPPGVNTRQFLYAIRKQQGWRFEGRGRSRRVAEAPCVECEVVYPAEVIEDRTCPACRIT